MSYILDALKKAEAERSLGGVPNVHTQPTIARTADHAASGWRSRLPWLLVLCLFVILLTGLAWLRPWQEKPAPVSTTANLPSAVAIAPPVPVIATITTAATIPVAPIVPPAPRAAPEPVIPKTANTPILPGNGTSNTTPATHPAKTEPAMPAASTPKAVTIAHLASKAVAPPQEDQAKPGTNVTASTQNENVQAEEKSIGTQQELPENIQHELPAFVVNGYIYAKNPADRSVLVNKKLLREGEQVTPDLTLEKLLPKGAILNYRGYRYRVSF